MSELDYYPESAGHELSLHALAATSRRLADQPDPVHALAGVVGALRKDLSIDRAGIFAYDSISNRLEHITGIDADGRPEFAAESFELSSVAAPLQQVALRDLPYYFSNDAPADYPDRPFAEGVRALAVLPILAGDQLLGLLCADNALSGKPIPPPLLDVLFLYGGLAALPLLALYQKRDNDRAEAMRRRICREVLFAVTSGKICLCEPKEINEEWPSMDHALSIREDLDIRRVREAVRQIAREAGMESDRVEDLGLCASEAATNALVHGCGGRVCVRHHEGRLRVRVEDHGEGISPENLPKATLQKGWSTRASMGMGFTLINETADKVLLNTGPDGTTLIIEMAVEPQDTTLDAYNPLLWEDEEAFALQ